MFEHFFSSFQFNLKGQQQYNPKRPFHFHSLFLIFVFDFCLPLLIVFFLGCSEKVGNPPPCIEKPVASVFFHENTDKNLYCGTFPEIDNVELLGGEICNFLGIYSLSCSNIGRIHLQIFRFLYKFLTS